MPDSTCKEKPFQPTMPGTEGQVRLFEAKVRFTEAKALTEAAKARQAQLDFDKSCGELVYVATALEEFNRALSPVMGALRSFSQTLVMQAQLTPEQHEIVDRLMEGIYRELSKVEFNFETAAEVERRAAESHLAPQKVLAQKPKRKRSKE